MRSLVCAFFCLCLVIALIAGPTHGTNLHHHHHDVATTAEPIEPETRYERYARLLLDCTRHHGVELEVYVNETRSPGGARRDKSKCVDSCMFKELRIMHQNGTIDVDNALDHLLSKLPDVDTETMKTNIERCSEKKGKDDCETAHNLMVCVFDSY